MRSTRAGAWRTANDSASRTGPSDRGVEAAIQWIALAPVAGAPIVMAFAVALLAPWLSDWSSIQRAPLLALVGGAVYLGARATLFRSTCAVAVNCPMRFVNGRASDDHAKAERAMRRLHARTPMTPRLVDQRVEAIRLTSRDQFLPWADRWDSLARASSGLFFRSAAWLLAWWETFAPQNSIELLVAGSPESPSGLLALTTLRQPLHPRLGLGPRCVVLAGSGAGAADHCGPNAPDPKVATLLLAEAARRAGRSPLLVDQLDRSHQLALSQVGRTTNHARTPCPRIDLQAVDRVDQLWTPKLGKELRRRRRRMDDEGFVGAWNPVGPGDTARLRPLQRLHRSLWHSRGSEGLFAATRMQFLVRLAERSVGNEGLWLYTIESGDDPAIGALLGFGFGRTFCSYKTGWDPAHHHLGLGVLMHAAAIERAKEQGAHTYDFLRGTEAHKHRLGGVDRVDRSFIVGSSATTTVMRQRARLMEWRDRRTASG